MRDIPFGKEELSGVDTCTSSHVDCSERNSQVTYCSVQNVDEKDNISCHDCEIVRFNPSQTGFNCPNSYIKASSRCGKNKPEETRINDGSRMICDIKNVCPSCDDDGRTGDDKLYKGSLGSDIDFAPSRFLSAEKKIKTHGSVPINFVRMLPVRKMIRTKLDQAGNLYKHFTGETRKDKRASKTQEKLQRKKSRIIIISPNHPYKILWNVFTMLLTFISAYTTHMSIRDRRYEFTTFAIFTKAWFILDVLLNFITAHRHSNGTVICTGSAVWARYLTTWFPIDVLALVPWEGMYLKPIILQQNKRNIIMKLFFRSRATVKVTRILRGRHFKIFGRVVNSTKKIGVGGKRLLALIIKYLPKYILFYRNMKAVLVLKLLRQIHFGRKVAKSLKTDPLKSAEDEKEDENSVYDHHKMSWNQG